MSADELRKAAETLRRLATSASPGPWKAFEQHGRDYTDEGWSQIGVTSAGHDVALTYPIGFENDYPEHDAAYIATVHPGVGLALADWLDEVAKWVAMTPPAPPRWGEKPKDHPFTITEASWAAMYPYAANIARLINGGAS